MSTKRTTRSTSQASRNANPNGPSPVLPVPGTPTYLRRAGGAPAGTPGPPPRVSARPSTAYGTNTIPMPAPPQRPHISEDLTATLEGILNPEVARENYTRPRDTQTPPSSDPRARGSASQSRASTYNSNNPASGSPTSSVPRSFIDESNIFGAANVDSSVVSSDGSPLVPNDVAQRLAADRATMQDIARQRVVAAHAARGNRFPEARAYIKSAMESTHAMFGKACPYLAWVIVALVALLLFACIGDQLYGNEFYGNGRNLGGIVSGNQSYFPPEELHFINQRLRHLESEVEAIKLRFTELDRSSIDKLMKLLPDELIVKKDKKGNLILSDDFWRAILEKMRSDKNDSQSPDDGGKDSSWKKFLGRNKATIDTYSMEHLSSIFPKLLRENHIATKQEIIESIQNTWNQHKDGLSKDMEGLKKQLDAASEKIKKGKHESGQSQKEIADAVAEELNKLIPQAQMEALLQARLEENTNHGLLKLNHLSKGTGAVVLLPLTTPTYLFPEHDVWFFTKWKRNLQRNDIPVVNNAETALTPWQEHGDCWCAPSANNGGLPTSLTVKLGNVIYPNEVVIEHILPTAALQPGAAPKEMELLVYVKDAGHLEKVQELSNGLFPTSSNLDIPSGFVRVAEWTYDAHSKNYIQKFDVGLDMKAAGVRTNKVMIRTKNNWGEGKVPYVCFYRIRLHGDLPPRPARQEL